MAAILKPYTFVAGTKAKANEVNSDFDTVYAGVNALDTTVTENTADIADLNTNKANINGSTSNRFSVANPVNSNDAVNKQYLFSTIANSLPYINGLGVAKDSNNTIHVNAGSCYDSTLTTLMELTSSLSKQNTEQSASTTYYVYLIADEDGNDVDVLISTSSSSPALPSGYDIYRRIGTYKTNVNNAINYVGSEGSSTIITNAYTQIQNAIMPNFSSGVGKSWSTLYLSDTSGWLFARGYLNDNKYFQVRVGTSSTYSSNPVVAYTYIVDVNNTAQMIVPIPQGMYYYIEGSGSNSSTIWYPCKGGN